MNDYIYQKAEDIVKRFGTRDPFEILAGLHVIVNETSRYKSLKGYCFLSCQTTYVMISSFLSPEEQRIVAAHELGHILLHKKQLKMAPMKEDILYKMQDNTEYEANLFAADLLLADADIEELSKEEDLNYFSICSSLYTTPELMSFKLFSMIHRGHAYQMPVNLDSKFLGKH